MRLVPCLTILALLSSCNARPTATSGPLVVDPEVGRYDLSPHIALFEDETAALTADEVREQAFVPLVSQHASEDLSASAWWVRVRLRNDTPHEQERVLEVARATLCRVELHLPDGTSQDSERFRAFSDREVPSRMHAFRISLPAEAETTLYVRITSQSELFFPIRLFTPHAFHQHDAQDRAVLGASYGALLLLALYHFVLFLRLRERHLLYFAIYVTLMTGWIWLVDGLSYATAGPLLQRLEYYPFATVLLLAYIFAALFAQSFLETAHRAKTMHRLIGAIYPAVLLMIALQAFVDHRTINLIAAPFWIATQGTLLVAGIVVWRSGMKEASWFVAAYAFYVASGLIAGLALNGLFVWFPFDLDNPFRVGLLADVFLMSFALASRLQTLARERAEARAFAATQAEAAEAEKSAVLGRLMAGILHEMNSPLGALKSASGSLEKTFERLDDDLPEGEPAKKLRRYLAVGRDLSSTMQTSGAQIASVVDSLKRFTAVDEGAEKRVDIRRGLDGALTLLAPEIGEGITIARDYPDEPAMALCKPAALNHALLELIRRAVDAPSTSEISVRVKVADVVTITIADDGAEIPEPQLAQLFVFGFARVGGKMNARRALPLAMQAVKGMAGTLEVTSSASGTVSTVTLPA